MRRDNTHYFIYPEYLDNALTRKEGRRLPLSHALESPTLLELRLAAEKLDYDYEVRENAAYSRQWWSRRGLILVEKRESKLQTLRDLSKEIKLVIRPALEKKLKEKKEERKKKKEGKKRIRKERDTKDREFRLKRRK